MRCLVTGATGYVGGRLVPRLLAEGYEVRCATRSAARLRDAPWAHRVEVVEADALDAASLRPALAGVDVAYHLIHSLDPGGTAAATGRRAAGTFAAAARDAGVGRLVHLGDLAPDPPRSAHQRSRAEVAAVLLGSGVPTAVLRAPVILGSGSASFEMLRHLTERLPVMVTPRWTRNRVAPIAIRDVLHYLVGCAALPAGVSRAFDLGGPDVLTYREMMLRYAAVAGLRRRVVVPTPARGLLLSALWVNAVTPVPHRIARPLVDGLATEALPREHDIAAYVPDPAGGLTGVDRALELALHRIRDADVETRWSTAVWAGVPSDPLPADPDWAGGSLYTDDRSRVVAASPDELWAVIRGIGGERGWYSFPLAWTVRGVLDRLVGGVGLRRGRRDPDRLLLGEALDFWRVEEIRDAEILRLRAEMRLPGLAWLELRVGTDEQGRTVYGQRALFHPRGLAGHAYWWSVAPFHGVVFGSMARNIAHAAEARARTPRTAPDRAA